MLQTVQKTSNEGRRGGMYIKPCGWCGGGWNTKRWRDTRKLSRDGYPVQRWRGVVLANGVRLPAELPNEQGGANYQLCGVCYFALLHGQVPPVRRRLPPLLQLPPPPPQPAGLAALSAAAEQLATPPPAGTPSADCSALDSLSSAAVIHDLDVSQSALDDDAGVAQLAVDDRMGPPVVEDEGWWHLHRYAHDGEAQAVCSQPISQHLRAVVAQVTRVVAVDLDEAEGDKVIGGSDSLDVNSKENWSSVLTEGRYVAARVWQPLDGNEKDCWLRHIALFDAGVDSVVYSDFPQGPPGLERRELHDAQRDRAEARLADWTEQLRRAECTQPKSLGSGRSRLQTLSADPGRSLSWIDDDAAQRDLLTLGPRIELPEQLQSELSLHTGQQLYVFFNEGGSGNPAHKDPVAGYSTLAMGWKVFIWWDAADASLFVNKRQHPLAIRLSRAASTPSLRWTLLGPGQTIFLHPDSFHAVVTLCSSALVTQARTFLPHRLIRSICLILTGQLFDSGWLFEGARASVVYPALLNFLVDATNNLLRRWRRPAVKDRPDMVRLRALMASGWAGFQDFPKFMAAQLYRPMGRRAQDDRQLTAKSCQSVKECLQRYEQLMTELVQHETVEIDVA